MSFTDTDKVWLGEDNFMMIGDAAGLIDLTRGVGMDAAALSGRLAANAIVLAEKTGKPVMPIYEKVMRSLVRQTAKNQSRGILAYKDNSELQKHLNMSLLKMGLKMLVFSFLNKRRNGEKQLMIP
jgi:flavin-dependent dehydrogenase